MVDIFFLGDSFANTGERKAKISTTATWQVVTAGRTKEKCDASVGMVDIFVPVTLSLIPVPLTGKQKFQRQ